MSNLILSILLLLIYPLFVLNVAKCPLLKVDIGQHVIHLKQSFFHPLKINGN